MSESSAAKREVSLETSIPQAGASLESILCTEELQRRVSRPPDYEKENRALVALMGALADSPGSIFQTLAETILDITQCDSAGLSLLTRDGKTPDVCGQRFYWPAIAGMWNPHVGGGTPRNFGPCGDVLDQNRTLLFRHFERRYPYLVPVNPTAEECLLVPFYVAGEAVGTIWGIMHTDRRKFDAEDDRVMASLGKFASSAYQAVSHIENLKFQVVEREKAEAEVRELAKGLEAKIRRLVDANVVGIVMWNLEGAITSANDAFLRMVQYDRDDLDSGRVRWTDLTPTEWHDGDERAIAELKVTGVFQPVEKEYFRKDGSRVPILLGGALFEGSEDEGVAFILDLSQQKRAERALRRSEALLTESQRLSLTGSFSWKVATDEITWSEQLYRIYELEIGAPVTLELIRTRVHPEDLTLIEKLKMVNQAGDGGNHFEYQYRLLMPDRSIKYLHAVAHSTQDKDGQLEYIAAVQDVTARKLAEEALDKARSELARVSRLTTMGELAASIAHEVNQPLTAVTNNANVCLRLLANSNLDPGVLRRALEEIVADGSRASAVISRIRAFIKKTPAQKSTLDINEVIQEVSALVGHEAQKKQVAIEVQLTRTLPLVWADRVQLQQVLLNLMMNGIEAMTAVTDRPRVLWMQSQVHESGDLLVAVRDSGTGLGSEPDRLFTPFFTTKVNGLGMGLSISRSFVESHNGRLWATPNSPHGAVFSFTLPAAGESAS
jgi:PAS domain S-box-containing protein